MSESKMIKLERGVERPIKSEGDEGLVPKRKVHCTYLFRDSIDSKLAELDNSLVMWEVARVIRPCSVEDQEKALSQPIVSDPRKLDPRKVLNKKFYSVDDELDDRISVALNQLEYEMILNSSKEAPKQEILSANAIQRLIESGQLRFIISLSLDPEKGVNRKLKGAQISSSNQLTRDYGSDCFLQVRMDSETLYAIQWNGRYKGVGRAVWKFLSRPIRYANRIYKAAIVKGDAVWFFSSPMRCQRPIGIMELIESVLPLDLNVDMKISKYKARLQLSLSSTSSTISFKPSEIRRVPDIYSNSLSISKELMKEVSEKLNLNYLPSSIEGSIKFSNQGSNLNSCSNNNQTYTWVLYQPTSLLGGTYIEVWSHDQISKKLWDDSDQKKLLEFEFLVNVYEPSLERWIDRTTRVFLPLPKVKILVEKEESQASAIMTDGAAALSWGAALKIKNNLGIWYLPSAFQARILKSKGLWYLNNVENKEEFWIEIRSSQWKANVTCPPDKDIPFNLCGSSSRANAGTVNRQSIPVYASRQVSSSTFCELMRTNFRSVLDSLTTTNAAQLAATLEDHGKLFQIKAERINTMLNGLRREDDDSVGFGCEKFSQRPLNPIEETVELLKSGFDTRNVRVIDRLIVGGNLILDRLMTFKLTVPESASVYVMPDPTGTLKEGEVFLKLTKFINPNTMLPISVLKDTCIVSRSPCVHPSDARKVTAVFNRHLMHYEDVLVCSTNGKKSLLDYLSGGDYDGDTVTVIWDKRFTETFKNSDPVEASIPFNEYDNLFSDSNEIINYDGKQSKLSIQTVKDLYDMRFQKVKYEAALLSSQLSALFQAVKYGRYAQMYKVCEYLLGVSHEFTKKIGYVYIKCLDASKQGIALRSEEDEKLKAEFEGILADGYKHPGTIPLPPWTARIDLARDSDFVGIKGLKRVYLPLKNDHVLEMLCRVMDRERDHFQKTLKNLAINPIGSSLTSPWTKFLENVEKKIIDGQEIRDFVEKIIKESYFRYRKALVQASPRTKNVDFSEAWTKFWIDGSFSNALDHVKSNVCASCLLKGTTEAGYNVLKASAAAAFTTQADQFFVFHMAFSEVCFLQGCAEEEIHLAKSGAFGSTSGRAPRAFSPVLNNAMMLKRKFLPE